MLKENIRMIGRFTILLVLVFQVFNSFCSRKVYPEIKSLSEEKNLKKEPGELRMESGLIPIIPPVLKTREISDDNKTVPLTALSENIKKESYALNISPDRIIGTARKYLGVPHCMAGISTKCIDCSGLLVMVFANYGISLPHNSEALSMYGKKISAKDELKKGDLVFFIRSYPTNHFITHSGIYIGDNKFIHASSGKGVTITSLNDPWWKGKFIFGTRILD